MLLGKIQSGKTRCFLGIIAESFDKGFDIALVFTKGTKTLAEQTVSRISGDFKEFIERDEVAVYDIMHVPERLSKSERRRKLIFVIKKETNNLRRVSELFENIEYPEMIDRRVLLVDDEADMASVRFVYDPTTKKFRQGTIAQQLDDLRTLVPKISYLQVTATPFALYLQPDAYKDEDTKEFVFSPKRPAFTELVPIHGGYVGGHDYFGEFEKSDPRYYLHVAVTQAEQDALRIDIRRLIAGDKVWESDDIKALRRAVMTFLIGVAVRGWQEKQARGPRLVDEASENTEFEDEPDPKFAMIIHNDTSTSSHRFQWEAVETLRLAFEDAAHEDDGPLAKEFGPAFDDISKSVSAHGGSLPGADEAFEAVKELLMDGEINVQRVNGTVEVVTLLDPDTAELKLRTRANIFIGGSLLDRGITIPSMISFYYGRSPSKMQADTVLQHSRMYGNRPREDLAVTRFFTTNGVFSRMRQIDDSDSALREAFERGGHDAGVVFLENDASKGIIPCSPDKVAFSRVLTIRPAGFYLPSNFDTVQSLNTTGALERIDAAVPERTATEGRFRLISVQEAIDLVRAAKEAIKLETKDDFSWSVMEGLLQYYADNSEAKMVRLTSERGRRLNKKGSGGKSGLSIIGGTSIRDDVVAAGRTEPVLVMLRQDGAGLDWAGKEDFWWPVLAAPTKGAYCVFAKP